MEGGGAREERGEGIGVGQLVRGARAGQGRAEQTERGLTRDRHGWSVVEWDGREGAVERGSEQVMGECDGMSDWQMWVGLEARQGVARWEGVSSMWAHHAHSLTHSLTHTLPHSLHGHPLPRSGIGQEGGKGEGGGSLAGRHDHDVGRRGGKGGRGEEERGQGTGERRGNGEGGGEEGDPKSQSQGDCKGGASSEVEEREREEKAHTLKPVSTDD